MAVNKKIQLITVGLLLSLAGCGGDDNDNNNVSTPAAAPTYYTTKTPYQPQQDAATYQSAPTGFNPVFTQLVARHGSRGLSSAKYDLAMYNIWLRAQSEGALTELGATLGPDIMKLTRANALLGAGVAGITTPGYGNLTQVGITEHKQLATRMLARQNSYFNQVAATRSTAPRQIIVVTSGEDRAKDSSNFFSQSLASGLPDLQSLIVKSAPLTAYPANAPVAQAAGVNHFLLYFHKLAAKTDLVTSTADPYYVTYQDSLNFQKYATDADMTAKVNAILADPNSKVVARAVLERLFTKAFVDKLDGAYAFDNTGSYTFTTDDGSFTATVTGDGKTTVKTLVDAVSMLYNLYIIAPAMKNEVAVDFAKYIPMEQAKTLAYLQDAQDFYQMGPGIKEANPITYKMAQVLLDDFFNEIDAIAKGDLSHAAKLRFTHAEIIIPFASLMGLKDVFTPVPKAETYTYDNNPWRGEKVSPMAANFQWDVVRDANGKLLVKLLYNERETDFKPACDSARYTTGSRYYDYNNLKLCYGHVAQ